MAHARHEPVLLDAVLGFLLQGPGLYLDATVGDGGHAEALLRRESQARLWANDREPSALVRTGRRLEPFRSRLVMTQGALTDLPDAWAGMGREPLAGALFDLGRSSPQLDDPSRGIAFRHDAPLDLRLDRGAGAPAA